MPLCWIHDIHLATCWFFPSRPVLSYLMEMNSGSRKPFCASKSFALSKASERHVHSMFESLGNPGPSPNTARTSPQLSHPQYAAVGARVLTIACCFRGCAGNALWLGLSHQCGCAGIDWAACSQARRTQRSSARIACPPCAWRRHPSSGPCTPHLHSA